MAIEELVAHLGSAMATVTFFYGTATCVCIYAIFREHFPQHLQDDIMKYGRKLVKFAYPYTQITFDEFTGERMKRSDAFIAIRNYLICKSSASARRLKADDVKESLSPVLSMDYNEEISDEFRGIKVWWTASRTTPRTMQIMVYLAVDEKRHYQLTFHNSQKELILTSYLSYVITEGKKIERANRVRKLYSNNPSRHWNGYSDTKWSHVAFEHPAEFRNLAMEETKKQEIKNDLIKFREGKDYYAKIGKAWKRGYLLCGPPGTGKSTLIAAMANFLGYDVYDLELSAVKDNTELRRLFIETSNQSIIVVEDIDCSLDLTGKRENKKRRKSEQKKDDEDEDKLDPISEKLKEEETDSKVTLSGVLNCVDGLWSSCGGERIIVFTTNYPEKLDPTLIRTGRMDKKIEMSYCCFQAFKVLAENYLGIDSHEFHALFKDIGRLLSETKMTPADVAENLMPKSNDDVVERRLNRLIEALETAKKEEGNKAEEEARGNGTKKKRNRSGSLTMKKRKRRTIH